MPRREQLEAVLHDFLGELSEKQLIIDKTVWDSGVNKLLACWTPPDRAALERLVRKHWIGKGGMPPLSSCSGASLTELVEDYMAWATTSSVPKWCDHWVYDGTHAEQEWRRASDTGNVVRKLTRFCDECGTPRPTTPTGR